MRLGRSLRIGPWLLGLSLLGYGNLAGAASAPREGAPHVDRTADAHESMADSGAPPSNEPARASGWASCESLMRAALGEPAAEGAPNFEAHRIEIFLRAKGEPVWFWRSPRAGTAEAGMEEPGPRPAPLEVSPEALVRRARMGGRDPARMRSLLLREGYLYAERPALAATVVRLAHAESLFDAPSIWIQRGERTLHAHRDERFSHYVYDDGPDAGAPVSLLLFDRVGSGVVPPALHIDFRSLLYRLGFDQLRVEWAGAHWMVAALRYGADEHQELLRLDPPRAEWVCSLSAPGASTATEREAQRERGRARLQTLRPLQRAIREQVRDELPFDEPRHEVGQEDGKLRPAWLEAYAAGKRSYRYRGDAYPVFGRRGQPLVPQVCVDFLVDTLERASGTWWRPLGEAPTRSAGGLDFSELPGGRGDSLRRIAEFVRWARSHPDWFDVLEIPLAERTRMLPSGPFAAFLTSRREEFRPGDMVLIGGYVPWDPRRYVHYHSFWVYESDPLTAMPLLIASNPGHPGIRTWRYEMNRTPRRSIVYRIRPRVEWLRSAFPVDAPAPTAPEPLTNP